jgi:copper chaperone
MKTIKIKGMSCGHCVQAVKKALGQIEGVSNVEVNLDKGEASYEEKTPVDTEILKDRIKKAGYELG